MIATTTDAAALLALLVRGKWAVRKVSSLARLLDAGPEAVAAALAELVGRGLVEIWSRPAGGPAAVLSPLAAAQLGVRLDASGRRWVPAGSRERAPRRYDSAPFRLDDLADPRAADPAEVVERGEELMLKLAARADAGKGAGRGADWKAWPRAVPTPTILGGLGIWPRAAVAPVCDQCANLPLPLLAYCCRCCRSGVDHLLPKARPMPDRKAPAKFRPKAAGARRAALRGGL
jgi:hypothetical protein